MCRHLAPLSRPPWRLFFSPFMPSFGPCLSGGRPAQLGAGRGDGLRRRQTPSICRFLQQIRAIAPSRQLLFSPSMPCRWHTRSSRGRSNTQGLESTAYHLVVLCRPSAMPVAHLWSEKGPVCAPYKEGGPKSRPTRSPRGSARKPTRQEVGAPPPSHNAGAGAPSPRPRPILKLGWGRFLWAGVVARTRGRARPNGKETACSVRLWKCTAASISSCDER